jgi:hypothetical protein
MPRLFPFVTLTDIPRDAGITLSCQMVDLQSKHTQLCKALACTPLDPDLGARLTVLELGTGCGIVGVTLASVLANCSVYLSDLCEARDIVEKNTTPRALQLGSGSTLAFVELDWDAELPASFTTAELKFDIVLAADCTYNPDSRYVVSYRYMTGVEGS